MAKKAKDLLSDEDMKPENIRITISMRLPADLLDAYRAEAEKMGVPYQTLMQMKLREGLDNSLEKRVEKLEKRLKGA